VSRTANASGASLKDQSAGVSCTRSVERSNRARSGEVQAEVEGVSSPLVRSQPGREAGQEQSLSCSLIPRAAGRAARWRNRNIERARANARKWHSDPENGRAHDQKRRALKRNAPGTHTAADLIAILKAQNHRCAYCRSDLRKAKRHVDHIQPLARGGSNDRANLQYLCAPCNLAKGARDPVEFAQELGRLL
jgi:5-methylcytosine-specific restriction endonuclease McrA